MRKLLLLHAIVVAGAALAAAGTALAQDRGTGAGAGMAEPLPPGATRGRPCFAQAWEFDQRLKTLIAPGSTADPFPRATETRNRGMEACNAGRVEEGRRLIRQATAELGAGATAAATPRATPRAATGATLYERLGGKGAITAVVDDFVANVAADERINRRFAGTDIPRFKGLLVDQICEATGGPCRYTGRDMRTTHTGMDISEAEFAALVGDLVRSLDKFKVPAREKDELLTALGGMKGDIVGV
jgi:hemoglobin